MSPAFLKFLNTSLQTEYSDEKICKKKHENFWHLTFLVIKCRVGGDIDLFIKSNFHKNVFLLVSLTTLGTFTEFWLVCSLSWVFKRFNHRLFYRRVSLLYHHWGCRSINLPLFISLDSWSIVMFFIQNNKT